MPDFNEFRELISSLRGENGCPWDKKQTLRSIAPYLLEEAKEAVDAVESGVDGDVCEELGDVMLVVCMMAQIAGEEGRFSFDDCVKSISEKIIRRHPHVFGDTEVDNEQDVIDNWKKIKEQEKREKAGK
ncbi:MAG TPA: MazG family protein [bacterium]|nr:MazG family protein [bacterium]